MDIMIHFVRTTNNLESLYSTSCFRSVVHRLGTRPDDARRDHRLPPRDSGIEGAWAHDKFTEHDKMVAYPIQQHQRGRGRERVKEVGRKEGPGPEEEKKQTETSMDTM